MTIHIIAMFPNASMFVTWGLVVTYKLMPNVCSAGAHNSTKSEIRNRLFSDITKLEESLIKFSQKSWLTEENYFVL